MTNEFGTIIDISGIFYADGKELASILDITKALCTGVLGEEDQHRDGRRQTDPERESQSGSQTEKGKGRY